MRVSSVLRIFRLIFLPLMVLWCLAFAVHNPELLTLNLWPLPYEIVVPVTLLAVLVLAVGYLLGAMQYYIKSAELRSQNAQHKKQLAKLEQELLPKS